MRTIRNSQLPVLGFFALTACTPPHESMSRVQLQQRVTSESGGALVLTEFTKTTGSGLQFAGVHVYTLGWRARLTVMSDIWKGGNAFTGYWSNFFVMKAQPGMWDNLVGGGNAREFVTGATIILTGKSTLQRTDSGWRVVGMDTESSQVLNNERSPEAVAELQRQKAVAEHAAEAARAQAEQERTAILEREAAEHEMAKQLRDSVIATARQDTVELAHIECEVRNEGTGSSFMIDSIALYRYGVTATNITKRILNIRSTRDQVWIQPADDAREVVWFDELTTKPGYYRGNASSLDRVITLKNDRVDQSRLYCRGSRGEQNRADGLREFFKVVESAVDAWRSKNPTLVRW